MIVACVSLLALWFTFLKAYRCPAYFSGIAVISYLERVIIFPYIPPLCFIRLPYNIDPWTKTKICSLEVFCRLIASFLFFYFFAVALSLSMVDWFRKSNLRIIALNLDTLVGYRGFLKVLRHWTAFEFT